MGFSGFPSSVHSTPVPDPVLGTLLEHIQDLAELKVTLRGFWLANQKKGKVRGVALDEFLNDKVLVQGLREVGQHPRETIRRGLDLAVKRHTFLVYQPDATHPDKQVYAVNTESARRSLDQLRARGDIPEDGNAEVEPYLEVTEERRPNIFALYENNIGTISPMLAERLKEAEEAYSWAWIDEAFQIAVTQNKRSWAYISAILRRWTDEGRDDGEPGRHSQEDNRERYIEAYRRHRGPLPWEPGGR